MKMKSIIYQRKSSCFSLLLAFLMIPGIVSAQIRITGNITDSENLPLPGVNIMIKGTSTGTITDPEGNYSIGVNSTDDVLQFSMMGMATQEIMVGNQTIINVQLEEESVGLEEVVVVGYGVMKKSEITGSIVSMGEDEITEVKTLNVMESLQGKMAGVDITSDGGRSGSGVNILIRGKSSLAASNDPLFIVDGIPYGTSIDLNPNDIASIEVLKDASSSAIYGSRGANGVILVTTKKGQAGEGKIYFNSYFGVTKPFQEIPVFFREGYIQAKIDANRDANWNEAPIDNVFQGYENTGYYAGTETNWQKICTRNGIRQDYQLGFNGGTGKTSYNTSLTYSNEKGITLADQFKRYTFKFNFDTDVKDYLTVGGSALVLYSQRDGRGVRFTDAIKSSPIVAPYDSTGTYIYNANEPNPRRNPLAYTYDHEQKAGQRILASVYGDLRFTPDLDFKSSFGLIYDNDREGYMYPPKQGYGIPEAGVQLDQDIDFTWTNLLNYHKEIDKHTFSVMLGHEVRYFKNEFYYMYGQNQTFLDNLWWNMGSTDQATNEASTSLRKKTLVSGFGRITYNYNNLIMINAVGRYDGASQLAKDHKWQFFPSLGTAVRVKQLGFMQNVDPVSDLKLRLGWGTTGNESVNAYDTQARLNKFPLHYQFGDPGAEINVDGYRLEFLASEDLTWEVTRQFNLGLDLGLFNNRISANIDLYQSHTDKLLLPARLPISTGYFTIITNAGETENKGVEVMLSSFNIDRDGFKWDMNVSFTANQEKLVALTSGQTEDEGNGWFVGYPVDVYYDFEKIGIWQNSDSIQIAEMYPLRKPGDIKVRDVDNNDSIDFDDRVILGQQNPKWTASWVNTFTYKGFDLSINIYARMGHMIDAEAYDFDPRMYDNMLAYDYWTPTNPTNEAPKLNAALAELDYEYTLRYRDGSYIKIKNITLGYTFPANWTKRIKISRLRAYATSNNPAILYSQLMKGIDPERNGSLSWPMARTFIFGLNVEF